VSKTVLYMSMSLDGFIAGPNESRDNGLGDGGERLHEWFLPRGTDFESFTPTALTGVNRQVFDEMLATGAVLAGRGTFEPAGGWGGDHHDGVPIFIISRHQPAPEFANWPLVTYLSDLETAVARAKAAAGDRNVLVHGAGIARMTLAAGLLDEIQIHLVPVLLGDGRRLFDRLGFGQIELEPIQVLEAPDVTHLRYVVRN
jgi:dihydrofolate reductase